MKRRSVKFIDPVQNVLASAHVTEEGDRYEGTIDLRGTPAQLRALFDKFEEIVNSQMFSLLDDVEGRIRSLSVRVVLEDGREARVKDLQVFPSMGEVSFKLAEIPANMRSA